MIKFSVPEIEALTREIVKMQTMKATPEDTQDRLAELEVKVAKLWSALLHQTPTGREKLSPLARRLGIDLSGTQSK